MKISGKVGTFRSMLEKMSCGEIFEPIVMRFIKDERDKEDRVISWMHRDSIIRGYFKFTGLEIEGSGEETIMLNGSGLAKQLAVNPDDADFTAELSSDRINVTTPTDTFVYYIDADIDDSDRALDKMPLSIEEGRIYLVKGDKKVPFNTKVEMTASTFGDIMSRMDVSGAGYVNFTEKDGKLKAIIGSMTSRKYVPRVHKVNADVKERTDDGENTPIAFGLHRVSKILEGDIELHYSQDHPLTIYNTDDEGVFEMLFIIAPTTQVD